MGVGNPGSESNCVFASLAVLFRVLAFIADGAGGSTMIGRPLSRLPGGAYVDLEKGDHRSSVFLAGSGRSGTTWLSEIINHRRGYRYVFEPFNPSQRSALSGISGPNSTSDRTIGGKSFWGRPASRSRAGSGTTGPTASTGASSLGGV